ncbi:NAD-dependent aldehyde dehydrogenase [Pseudomonas sp. GM21]|uniref:coniferyl aldehyde dehydrogenase n=1 Tax=Pseudomonas sp. GM21 TaxID=1144325 RepID=UPI00027258F6|nr:coniferyl aldehyde dehydrogenase [Pseudomonas sp. GM21]EJM24355.1 NAD-dependent aldehyde dehydrogenase [Pseudomonas sp. GM21]
MNASTDETMKAAATRAELMSILAAQKQALLNERFPSAKVREDRLDRLLDVHVRYKDKIIEALSSDFGGRSRIQSLVTDVVSTVGAIKYTRGKVRQWMRPQRRQLPLIAALTGGRAEVHYQPLGVVGNISPWNFPVGLAFTPAIEAIAAGNRVMLKPSEVTPASADIIREMVCSAFSSEEIAVVTGGVDVGQAFSTLPFDHLVFTGGPEVARHVMSAAAQNLVPVTLELGGKCPVVIGESARFAEAVERILTTKAINSGQLCLTPDYVFVPKARLEEFISQAQAIWQRFYPQGLLDNDDYTAIVNPRHWQRVQSYLDEAKGRGTRIVQHNTAGEDFSNAQRHKLPPTLVIEPADDLRVMKDEIFGPLLSVKGYDSLDQVIDFINARPRPLALYYFGYDKTQAHRLLLETTSGGVTINDAAQHVAFPDLPLGGVGNSGMGAYHGKRGFLQFSHGKAVYRQGWLSMGKFFRPPFTEARRKLFESQLK